MAQFTFDQYNEDVHGSSNASVKIGFFKLAEGAEALIRINAGTNLNEDLTFATVHAPNYGHTFEGLGSGYTPVSCLGEFGSYTNDCPFCKAAAEGHEVVGKAQKKVYVQMLVAYADPATGGWSKPVPVIWERPAGFARELASKVKSYGSLRDYVFKVTRTGQKKETRYTLDFIPMLNKPELVSDDFGAFKGFNIAKHSYWEKPASVLETYLSTGRFPEADETPAAAASATVVDDSLPVDEPKPAAAPAASPAPAANPAGGFGGFSF